MSHEKEITVIVNGRPKVVTEKELSFLEVVQLAYPDATLGGNKLYTVRYFRREGDKHAEALVEAQTLKVKEGMVINVSQADKS
jgi:hypothetical protein